MLVHSESGASKTLRGIKEDFEHDQSPVTSKYGSWDPKNRHFDHRDGLLRLQKPNFTTAILNVGKQSARQLGPQDWASRGLIPAPESIPEKRSASQSRKSKVNGDFLDDPPVHWQDKKASRRQYKAGQPAAAIVVLANQWPGLGKRSTKWIWVVRNEIEISDEERDHDERNPHSYKVKRGTREESQGRAWCRVLKASKWAKEKSFGEAPPVWRVDRSEVNQEGRGEFCRGATPAFSEEIPEEIKIHQPELQLQRREAARQIAERGQRHRKEAEKENKLPCAREAHEAVPGFELHGRANQNLELAWDSQKWRWREL